MDFSKLTAALTKNGFSVKEFENSDAANVYLDGTIDGVTVAIGGSMTVLEMGLYDRLSSHNNVLWHWKLPEGTTVPELLKSAQNTDVYITSANGIAESGEIINIDGTCNRISSMVYGHKKIVFVIGENKVEETFEKALYRARNIAAPLNAKRLNKKTPCAVKGDKCYNCNCSDRICRGFTFLTNPPEKTECEVILIHQKLGY